MMKSKKDHEIIESCIRDSYNVTKDQLRSKTRTTQGNITLARQLCMYFIKKYTFLNNKETATLYNRTDTQVYNSIKAINNLVVKNEQINRLKKKILVKL